MTRKIKLTRPALKQYRDALNSFRRYLPMLKLKQRQLQITLRAIHMNCREADESLNKAKTSFRLYEAVLGDMAGVNVRGLSKPQRVKTTKKNIAGINIPVFEGVVFSPVSYSLFGTPAWVDRALSDLCEVNRLMAMLSVLRDQYELLDYELTRIIQRVNLFEKIKIPEAQEAIRVIRIHLGDEMTAAVGRAKIAKAKLVQKATMRKGNVTALHEQEEDINS